MLDELTPDEMKSIAAEIERWNSHIPAEDKSKWQIYAITQLGMLHEAYEVTYQNGYGEFWFRNEQGALEPATHTVYLAPDYDHKKESEA